ncbi:MAG: mitochondrial fission ELM1 family protein [Candidatus Omnitrophica bacterium]|nr:mitochondrial fission ELM1 family protein [Candidatus Omnitrophota bacterium]
MLDLIASYFVRGMNLFLHVMPMSFNLWLGRNVGRFVYLVSGKRVRITYSNLKAAFCGEKYPDDIRRIARGVYVSVSETFTELLSMTKVDKKYVDKYIKVHNLERLKEAAANPQGMILLSAHFGNWELSTVASVFHGFPLYLLARDQKMKRLNELFNLLRESKGNMVIRKGVDIKNIFRLLKAGKSLGILGDQNAGSSGVLLELFGRTASTAVGPYRFAQASGAVILPAFMHRRKGPYQDLYLEEPMVIKKDDDIIPFMKRYNALLEKHIRMSPAHWFWMHKKWKMTDQKKMLVLNDGKKGHFNQSLAILEVIKKYRVDKGFASLKTQSEVAEVDFRSRTTKLLINAVGGFVPTVFGLHLKFLKACVTPESYSELADKYADIIIGTGSSLTGVSLILKKENNSRNVAVLDPGGFIRKKFDLVVIPRHDISRGKHRLGTGRMPDNVVVTDLAPNLISPDKLEDMKNDPGDGKTLGILLGGDNTHFSFTEEMAAELIENVKKICAEGAYRFLLTTSRRTPPVVDFMIKKELSVLPSCKLFVCGREDISADTVPRIMSESDILIVTGDSISMVSESVSSGNKVIAFKLARKNINGRETKYDMFLSNLAAKGLLVISSAGSLSEAVKRADAGNYATVVPEDNKKIYEKVYKLF